MSDAVQKHPLETDKARFGIQKPVARFDLQGDMSDEERVANAMENFAKDINRTTATYMESCMHCGVCAEACHYYNADEGSEIYAHLETRGFQAGLQTRGEPVCVLLPAFQPQKESHGRATRGVAGTYCMTPAPCAVAVHWFAR